MKNEQGSNTIQLDRSKTKKGYEEQTHEALKIFVNGILIKTDFDYRVTAKVFKQRLVVGGGTKLNESQINIVVKIGCLEKEINIQGFLRKINIGEWE